MTCRQWNDLSWDGCGHHISPNMTLGTLLHHHYPGLLSVDGVQKLVTSWEDYRSVAHIHHTNVAAVV
jgi:hypothetical protein